MYLHLGGDTVVNTDEIIGIFDLESASVSRHTRKYFARLEKEGKVINVSYELPKSFIVTNGKDGERLYISQISTSTLIKRMEFIPSLDVRNRQRAK
ncbi:MAG: DUF370 domain-containing protein [Clostridia bacterium]|nr:DUF370 domain-containing protein [Clostridia bacterium]